MIPIANPDIGEAESNAVKEVLDSGILADGPEVRSFEEEFADYCTTEHGIATSNGTTALHTALEALGIGPGDTVLTTPFSFVASANAIRLAGAEPIFADINPDTFNLDPDAVEGRIRRSEDGIDALIVVHLYGLPADMSRFRELAEEYDFAIIEDAAQAHGATVNGERVGSIGDLGCFSFYPTKNMTTGEGGMITTDHDTTARRAEQFINHGRSDQYDHERLGHNFRMTSIAAAIGREQLSKLDTYAKRRRDNANKLTQGLSDVAVTTPNEPTDRKHVYHQYTIRYEDRDGLLAHLQQRSVGATVYYPTPIHQQKVYDHVVHEAPEAEAAAQEVVSLPVHPSLNENDVETVINAVREYVGGVGA